MDAKATVTGHVVMRLAYLYSEAVHQVLANDHCACSWMTYWPSDGNS